MKNSDDAEIPGIDNIDVEGGSKCGGVAEQTVSFRKLTPAQSNDVIAPYRDALDFVFGEEELCNIAISGPYGSGKSSVAESLQGDPYYSSVHKFMTISIGHFRETPVSTESDCAGPKQSGSSQCNCAGSEQVDLPKRDCAISSDQKTVSAEERKPGHTIEQELEGQVLNHLIHSMTAASLPRSRFRKTRDARFSTLITAFIAVFLLLASLFVAFGMNGLLYRLPRDMAFAFQAASLVCIIAVAGFAVVYAVRRFDPSLMLRRINVQGNSIELFDRSNDSIFDKYLDDVLYILERCHEDVIFFEDMDRFDNGEIFEKLRELNQLANEARRKARQSTWHRLASKLGKGDARTKPLRFFYMVRDDVFIPVDRTKFFDFIITVIPHIDSTNSGDELVKALEGEGIDPGFLYELSLYIDDARILNNIVNEYVQHSAVLFRGGGLREGDCERLLAMVTYKNLFPADHALLYLNDGYLHALFVRRDRLIEYKSDSADQTEGAEAGGNETGRERFKDVADLAGLETVPDRIIAKLPGMGLKELFETLQVKEEPFFNLVDGEFESELISRDYMERVYRSRYFDLIRFLLLQGYIDRSYRDYMSIFREGGVSWKDREFLRDAGTGRSTDASYDFEYPVNAVLRTPKQRFAQKAYRNRSLLNALMESGLHGNAEKLSVFMRAIVADNDVEFALDYVCSDFCKGEFFAEIVEYWPDMPSDVIQANKAVDGDLEEADQKQIRVFAWRVLASNRFRFDGAEDADSFVKYVNNEPLILSAEALVYGDIIKALKDMGAKLSHIDEDESDRDLIAAICMDDLYQPNTHMVAIMLKTVRGVDISAVDPSVILTTIESARDGIYDYCNDSIEILLESVLTASGDKQKDGETAALWVLNRKWPADVEDDVTPIAERYVRALQVNLISSLDKVENQGFWPILLSGLAVKPTTANAALYYNVYANGVLDDALVEFINELGLSDLSKRTYEDNFTGSNFIVDVLQCDDLDLKKLELILKESKAEIKAFSTEKVPQERMVVAFSCGTIAMNRPNLEFVFSYYSGCIARFIKSSPSEYVKIAGKSPSYVDKARILELFEDEDVEDDEKIELASLLPNLSPNSKYCEMLNIHIIENQFDPSAVDTLAELRDEATPRLANVIDAKYVELAGSGKGLGKNLPFESCLAIMQADSDDVSISKKIDILVASMPRYDRDQVGSCLQAIGFANLYKVVVREAQSAKLEVDEADRRLIEALQRKGYCGKYHEKNCRLYSRG